jgi:hypothetical protein
VRVSNGEEEAERENKTARLPYVDPSTKYARTLRHPQAPDARWRAEKIEHSRTPLGRREWAAQQGSTGPLVASPRPRSLGCGGAAGMPLCEHFVHGEGNSHT